MTAQMLERLIYQGETHGMACEPLKAYLEQTGIDIHSLNTSGVWVHCTALSRGYVGTWEVLDDRLYLVSLAPFDAEDTTVSLECVFPGWGPRVFAQWFSGEIRVPLGKMTNYVHGGFASTWEQDLFLHFEHGVLLRTRCIQNT